MGQKVNPIANRLGIVRGWDSNWFGGKNFGDNLVEDRKIRKYLNERLAKASVSRIIIERTLKFVTITICTARPGIVIGKGGQDVDKLKEELKKLYDKDIQINIFEVKKPDLDATIVANNLARQIEGKVAYRRAIKMAIANAMRAGAEGIKVQICGRLNGAEMARKEMLKEGRGTHQGGYSRHQGMDLPWRGLWQEGRYRQLHTGEAEQRPFQQSTLRQRR